MRYGDAAERPDLPRVARIAQAIAQKEPLVGRELRGATLGGAAASVRQPVGAVGLYTLVARPRGVDVVGGRRSAAAIRRAPA